MPIDPKTGRAMVYDPATGTYVPQGSRTGQAPVSVADPGQPQVAPGMGTINQQIQQNQQQAGQQQAQQSDVDSSKPWYTGEYGALRDRIGGAWANQGGNKAASDKLDSMAQQFQSTFKNMTGKDPSSADWGGFWTQLPNGLGTSGFGYSTYSDVGKFVNDYVKNQYNADVQSYGTSQLEKQTQDVIDKQTQEQLKYLTSPDVMNQIKGSFNRSGMLDSGAFEQGVGNTLAGGANQASLQNLQGNILPAVAGMSPVNMAGGMLTPSGSGQGNFDMNQQLAKAISSMSQPTDLQQWAPIIQGALQGGGMAASGKTFICTHLKKLGLATEEEVKMVHDKLSPVFIYHPIDIILYFLLAPVFIKKADVVGYDWKKLKTELVDEVIKFSDPEDAFNYYRSICARIFMDVTGKIPAREA